MQGERKMKKYVCSVNLKQIVLADSKEQACEIFIENHDFEDLYPDCKEFRKRRKKDGKNN